MAAEATSTWTTAEVRAPMRSTAAEICSKSVTSARRRSDTPPACSISRQVKIEFGLAARHEPTRAPAAAEAQSQTPLPDPRPAPVTRTPLSFNVCTVHKISTTRARLGNRGYYGPGPMARLAAFAWVYLMFRASINSRIEVETPGAARRVVQCPDTAQASTQGKESRMKISVSAHNAGAGLRSTA